MTDALDPVAAPRWLVVRDRYSHVVEFIELPPRADLRAALQAKAVALVADGWAVGDVPRRCAFLFADRANERVCVSVEHFEPGSRPVSHG